VNIVNTVSLLSLVFSRLSVFFLIFAPGSINIMGRILAIDYGVKRTGLAVSDPDKIIASPLKTVATKEIEAFLREYMVKEDVEAIIIGYPKTMDNKPSGLIKHLDPFINRLRKIFIDTELHLVDERFTSSIARQAMIDGGMKKSDRQKKDNIDKISASLILQSYLTQIKNYSK
jgi:putative Holliday junction resolvase